MSLDTRKSTSGEISTSDLKMAAKYCSDSLTDCINNSIHDCQYPSELKAADISPVHKKGDPMLKENYRPVSILPTLSKVYEKILFNQISKYMENELSKYLCGFRKKYTRFLFYKHRVYKHHQAEIWSKIKHHVSITHRLKFVNTTKNIY